MENKGQEGLEIIRGMITILNRSKGEIAIAEAWGLDGSQKSRGRYSPGEGITGKVIETGNPVTVKCVADELLFVFPLVVPPLRESKTDIISPKAVNLMTAYSWPGNVRELENCIERAVILSGDGTIHSYHLPQPSGKPAWPERRSTAADPEESPGIGGKRTYCGGTAPDQGEHRQGRF
jgi:hypothetical protein